MTRDEMERAIEFLLESHATLTAKTEANTEAISALTAKVDANTDSILALGEQGRADRAMMARSIAMMARSIDSIRDSVAVMALLFQGTAEQMAELKGRVEALEQKP